LGLFFPAPALFWGVGGPRLPSPGLPSPSSAHAPAPRTRLRNPLLCKARCGGGALCPLRSRQRGLDTGCSQMGWLIVGFLFSLPLSPCSPSLPRPRPPRLPTPSWWASKLEEPPYTVFYSFCCVHVLGQGWKRGIGVLAAVCERASVFCVSPTLPKTPLPFFFFSAGQSERLGREFLWVACCQWGAVHCVVGCGSCIPPPSLMRCTLSSRNSLCTT
jgi:hypothetical protein